MITKQVLHDSIGGLFWTANGDKQAVRKGRKRVNILVSGVKTKNGIILSLTASTCACGEKCLSAEMEDF